MKNKINIYDVSLILVIIIVNCLLIYYNSKNIVYSDNNEAFIYSNNELVGQYVLKKGYENEFTIKTDDGYNKIKIKDNKVWITDADCRDKYCIHQGAISGAGQVIVCLPHKLLIKIKGDKQDNEIDFMVH